MSSLIRIGLWSCLSELPLTKGHFNRHTYNVLKTEFFFAILKTSRDWRLTNRHTVRWCSPTLEPRKRSHLRGDWVRTREVHRGRDRRHCLHLQGAERCLNLQHCQGHACLCGSLDDAHGIIINRRIDECWLVRAFSVSSPQITNVVWSDRFGIVSRASVASSGHIVDIIGRFVLWALSSGWSSCVSEILIWALFWCYHAASVIR